jgi:hypothetical protein
MKDSFKKAGYDLEEIYFYKVNQELIQKLKNKREPSKSEPRLRLVSSQDKLEEAPVPFESKKKQAA